MAAPGRRAFGVPPGGAFDETAHRLANALVGNTAACATIELGLASLRLEALEEVAMAWVGAGADGAVRVLRAGESCYLPMPATGARSYLSLPGGVEAPDRLLAGRILHAGRPLIVPVRRLAEAEGEVTRILRYVEGPQAASLSADCLAGTFQVAFASDRVGIRLEGNAHPHSLEYPSEPAVLGTIQVPPNGQPIILGPDGPTIGGYPKAGVVIGADLDRLAQIRPGDEIEFEPVDLSTARALTREKMDARRSLIQRLSIAL